MSDSLLRCIDRVAVDVAIIVAHWNAALELSGKFDDGGGEGEREKRIDFSIKISLHGRGKMTIDIAILTAFSSVGY